MYHPNQGASGPQLQVFTRHVGPHERRVKKPEPSPLPGSPESWLEEIRAAYADAREAIPFGPLVGHRFGERELYQLAPEVALKFRNLPSGGSMLKRATEAALSSYVANLDDQGPMLSDPWLAFAFCYLASHYGLGLVDLETAESVMQFLERNAGRLKDTGSRED